MDTYVIVRNNIEKFVDSHAVVKNNTERSWALNSIFFNGNTLQYHNQDTDINEVKIQTIFTSSEKNHKAGGTYKKCSTMLSIPGGFLSLVHS